MAPWDTVSATPVEICSRWKPGTALEAEVVSVKKGRAGAPGQLQGAFQKDAVLGELEKNTRCGVFGTAAAGWSGIPLPVAETPEIHTGTAAILSNISGTEVREYSVEILKLYPGEKACGRNLLLHVTDPGVAGGNGGNCPGDEWVAHHTRWQTDWGGYPCVSQ